ncbi:MAG: hypothetical protein R2817_06800 [Flavobacteriales bacterium]
MSRISGIVGLTLGCVLMVFSTMDLRAQSTGRILFDLSPAGTTSYVLDGKYRMSDRQLELMEGPHRFVFWAPERRMLDTTIVVLGGGQVDVRIELRYSEEYIAWRRSAERANVRNAWLRYAPPVIMAGSAVMVVLSVMKHEQAFKDLNALTGEYRSSVDPARITAIKREELPDAKSTLAKTRTGLIASGSVFALSTAATFYLRHRARADATAPFEDKERVRFEGLVYAPLPQGAVWGASLSIPLAR